MKHIEQQPGRQRLIRAVLAIGLAALAGLLIMLGPVSAASPEPDVDKTNLGPAPAKGDAKPASDCVAVEAKSAELVQSGGKVLLKVRGEAPHVGMTIEARPALKVLYVKQPDYLPVQLVACVPAGTKLPADPTAFAAEIDISGLIGIKGIELSGKPGGKPKRLELAG